MPNQRHLDSNPTPKFTSLTLDRSQPPGVTFRPKIISSSPWLLGIMCIKGQEHHRWSSLSFLSSLRPGDPATKHMSFFCSSPRRKTKTWTIVASHTNQTDSGWIQNAETESRQEWCGPWLWALDLFIYRPLCWGQILHSNNVHALTECKISLVHLLTFDSGTFPPLVIGPAISGGTQNHRVLK